MSSILGVNDAFDRAIAPVIGILSQEQAAQIANFHADQQLQLAEYEGYAQANRFLAVLQAKARRLIDANREG
jgi:hypothetical protein